MDTTCLLDEPKPCQGHTEALSMNGEIYSLILLHPGVRERSYALPSHCLSIATDLSYVWTEIVAVVTMEGVYMCWTSFLSFFRSCSLVSSWRRMSHIFQCRELLICQTRVPIVYNSFLQLPVLGWWEMRHTLLVVPIRTKRTGTYLCLKLHTVVHTVCKAQPAE